MTAVAAVRTDPAGKALGPPRDGAVAPPPGHRAVAATAATGPATNPRRCGGADRRVRGGEPDLGRGAYHGELRLLGHRVVASTIRRILSAWVPSPNSSPLHQVTTTGSTPGSPPPAPRTYPTCTRGLGFDRAGVDVALTLLFHNGGTKGVNTKTKRITRQMHGRAGSAFSATASSSTGATLRHHRK